MKRLILLCAAIATLLIASVAEAGSVISCQTVTTSSVTVLAANNERLSYAIWTTAGAATVYFRDDGGTANVDVAATGFLVGGASYTADKSTPAPLAAVKAITKAGSAWVCTKESR